MQDSNPKFMEWAYTKGFDRSELERMYLTAPLHSDFGAPADHASFHTPMQWSARTDPIFGAISQRLMKISSTFYTIDRSIIKLPGKVLASPIQCFCNATACGR